MRIVEALLFSLARLPAVPDVVTTFPASGMIQSQLREKRSVLKVVAIHLTHSYRLCYKQDIALVQDMPIGPKRNAPINIQPEALNEKDSCHPCLLRTDCAG